ncbi:Transmembrane emp24 domain-containing protein p24beta3 [Porphyridium purpureum]|uniref:Transmembrane emp24 domain-containing protein p24beta3 n=1 Tax=Porphyridium purpureum TaxID=35688 RepID=A0A5J4Z3J5_PORPP|nr:Transmembrane emp24 domain-containing protein p24beta3 [Porphyridium purpureum]|eukprot:POR6276..scf295_1
MRRVWTVWSVALACAAAACVMRVVSGLSFSIEPGQKPLCFYELTHKQNKVLAFFDVVSWGYGAYVYLEVKSPRGMIIKKFEAESEGRIDFVAEEDGEYTFCFSNSYAATEVSFWVNIENDFGLSQVIKEEHVNDMVYAVERLNSLVSAAKIDLASFKAREARHRKTAESNRRRVMYWSLVECALIVAVAAAQVVRIRKLFENRRAY